MVGLIRGCGTAKEYIMSEDAKRTIHNDDIDINFKEVRTVKVGEFKHFIRVFFGRPIVIFGSIILIIFIICTLFPSQLAPYDPVKQDLGSTLLEPSRNHILGTDALGRDMFSRIIFGARTAMIVGVISLFVSSAIGMVLGLIAGYFGGFTYSVIMRTIDAFMSIPPMILPLTIAALLGGGMQMVIIALGISMMPGYARVMCSQALTIKENDYIAAQHSLGASQLRIMFRHVLPNAFPPMIVMMTMSIGMTILAEAGLSYIGIGITEPTIAWGSLVNDGQKYLLSRPIMALTPGIAIGIVVFAFNMVGDGLRDALDPKLKGIL
jgi:peptide/nickel transport system permease protein